MSIKEESISSQEEWETQENNIKSKEIEGKQSISNSTKANELVHGDNELDEQSQFINHYSVLRDLCSMSSDEEIEENCMHKEDETDKNEMIKPISPEQEEFESYYVEDIAIDALE